VETLEDRLEVQREGMLEASQGETPAGQREAFPEVRPGDSLEE